jgi:hypothetical protein
MDHGIAARPFCALLRELDYQRQRVGLHTRCGSDGRPIERHAPATPTVALIRAAVRRGAA